MDIVGLVAIAATVMQLIGLIRHVRGKEWDAAITTVLSAAAGVGVLALFAQTQFAGTWEVEGITVGDMSGGTLIWVGIILGTGASTLHDTLRAVDSTGTTNAPKLLSGHRSNG